MLMTNINYKALDLIKYSLWRKGKPIVDENVFSEFKKHTLVALPVDVLSELQINKDLADRWRNEAVCQIIHYYEYTAVENGLPITVPYVIIKGSAAARYYIHPEYRAMGDIDIMTKSEDYLSACEALLQNGYKEILSHDTRHREFIKNGIVVEVHQSFAHQNNKKRASFIDEQIINGINSTHYLPDLVNGLVLLEHIFHHLIDGLGLRQILDWMLFVNQYLSDEKWLEFYVLAEKAELSTLAITVTRMCEMYLGLPKRKWSQDADSKLCSKLMHLIMDSGNFASKYNEEVHASSVFFMRSKTVKEALQLLQFRGNTHWNEKYSDLLFPPFGWLYQLGRYFILFIQDKDAIKNAIKGYKVGKERQILIEAFDSTDSLYNK